MKPTDITALFAATTAGTANDPGLQSAVISFAVAITVYAIRWVTEWLRRR